MTYPQRVEGGTPRTLAMEYGDAASIDYALSRVAAIADGQYGRLAGYTYAGSSRRVGSEFGPLTAAVIQQTFAKERGHY